MVSLKCINSRPMALYMEKLYLTKNGTPCRPPSPANVPEKISTELPNSKQSENAEKLEKSEKPENETESPMEIGAWPKFPSTEIFLSFEIPTPISPIPDLERNNDDSIQETAKVPKIILYFMWDHPFKMLAFLRGGFKS